VGATRKTCRIIRIIAKEPLCGGASHASDGSVFCSISKSGPANGYEEPARSLWTYGALDDLAGVRRLKLNALVAALIAIRMILVRDRLLRYFRSRRGRVRLRAEDHRGASCARRTQHRAARKWCRPASRLFCHGSLSWCWSEHSLNVSRNPLSSRGTGQASRLTLTTHQNRVYSAKFSTGAGWLRRSVFSRNKTEHAGVVWITY
jgi:hypothetical protein